MFGFANALLLALFAAAGVDLVLALRRKAVGQLFTVPHYLFGDWGGVVTGVHFVSDVLAGLAFGLVFAVAGRVAYIAAASALGFYAIMVI